MTLPLHNCIIIEDDPVSQFLLENMITSSNKLNLIGNYSNPIEAINSDHYKDVDVLFLDIQTPAINGFDFIRKYKPKQQIIVTTSNKDYAIKGFEYGVIDFILKPISRNRFNKAINKLKQEKKQPIVKDHFFIKVNKEYVKLNLDEILWIDACSEYIEINLKDKHYLVHSNMENILAKLNSNFVRIHRSHIIALDKVKSLTKNYVVINNNRINISKTYCKNLIEKLGID